jgi:hypothetical protein
MTASPRVALFQQAPTSADVDRLTRAHERMRRDLVCLVEEFGQRVRKNPSAVVKDFGPLSL